MKIDYSNVYPNISELLLKELNTAAIQRELLEFEKGALRGLGKTTALIKFAKQHDLGVFTSGLPEVKELRNKFSYPYIYNSFDTLGAKMMEIKRSKVVVDTNVNHEKLKELGFDIVTGYKYTE